MKVNSDLFVNSVESSNILETYLQPHHLNDKLLIDLSPELEPQKTKNYIFLNNFWKRLITWPQNFLQTPNSTISSILVEDTGKLASGAKRSVLANKLELSIDSIELSNAIEDSFEIYHEDYPYDFILGYKGERLGMMLLDKCFNSNGEAKLIYRFNPHIKSFRGLY